MLDVLAQRQPFVVASARALNTVTQGQVQGYVSGHAVTNIFYILRRQIGSEAAKAIGLKIIITRNISDFVNSPIPAMLPEDFLATLSV